MNKYIKVGLIVLGALIIAGSSYYIGYNMATKQVAEVLDSIGADSNQNSPTPTPKVTDPSITTLPTFPPTGNDTVTPSIPKITWTVKKYYDGKGSGMLMDGAVYKGVTGIEVINNKIVGAKIEAVYGVGGTNLCSKIYKFADTSPDFIKAREDENKYPSNSPYEIVDLANHKYEDFMVYGVRARRVGSAFYWTKETNANYFNPECGTTRVFINTKGSALYFTANGEKSYNYQLTLNDKLTEEELSSLVKYISTLK